MPRVTFQCNESFVSHLSDIIFFTNLKFWPSFKPMIIYHSAKGDVLKKIIFGVCSYEAQTLRNGCIASLLPPHQFLEQAGEVL